MSEHISAAIEILHLANGILSMANKGANPPDSTIRAHFSAIGRIAADNAAKPEIQGYSAHG